MRLFPSIEAPGNPIRDLWDRLSPLPGGKRLYSKTLGWMAPYTGTIDCRVEELRQGYARVSLKDRRAVRNHLRCVHAIALVNLAEVAGNLALGYALADDARFIPVGIDIEYLKKARGTITAESQCPVPEGSSASTFDVPVSLKNAEGVEVARAVLHTKVGPKKRA